MNCRHFLLSAAILGAAACAASPVGANADTPPPPISAVATAKSWFMPSMDWSAITKGGRGGKIVKVTTLAPTGPGSLGEALAMKGPRIVVFEVGGVIDLGRSTLTLDSPYVTIAGQTAPSPGITLIRGGVDIKTHDVIVQHIRVRPGDNGEARGTGFAEDSMSTASAYNLILDHCSLTWAVDENMSASGPRFTGSTPEEWRKGTSHNILYSNNIVAEGLADATHPKFEHSKGSLIHDNVSDILIYANLYAHNYERNPLFKGGVHGSIVNNFIFDPGQRAIHYNLQGLEWGETPFETGKMQAIGNVMRAGQSTVEGLPMFMIGGDGDLELEQRDNIAVDRWGEPLPMFGRYATGRAKIIEATSGKPLPAGLPILPAVDVERFVLANAGARPWDRDAHDVRILADSAEGRGHIINSQSEVGGYPKQAETRKVFNPAQWNLDTMEPKSLDVLDAATKARGT